MRAQIALFRITHHAAVPLSYSFASSFTRSCSTLYASPFLTNSDYCSMPQPTAGPMPDEGDPLNKSYTRAWEIVKQQDDMRVRNRRRQGRETKGGSKEASGSADHRDSTDLVSTLLNLATESIPSYVEQSSLMMIVVPISKQ